MFTHEATKAESSNIYFQMNLLGILLIFPSSSSFSFPFLFVFPSLMTLTVNVHRYRVFANGQVIPGIRYIKQLDEEAATLSQEVDFQK